MEQKLTNSGPLRESVDKHSIYPRARLTRQGGRMPEPQRFVFGAFQLDLREERLWCGPAVVHLPPKPFAVLACLVTRAGQLVTKDALLAAVWPDTVVSEDVLTAAIRQLRRVLGDPTHLPQVIETVHGRGYRFIAPVRATGPPEPLALLAPPRRA